MKTKRSKFATWLIEKFSNWLLQKVTPPRRSYLCDFKKIGQEVKPADVLLIEGRSRVSKIISRISQSPWTHSALYIGRLEDIKDPLLHEKVARFAKDFPSSQLLVESLLGQGNIISPLEKYRDDHIRILRPIGLTPEDAQKVIRYTIKRLGRRYSMRHLFDLGRFLFPWGLFPRRWRSTLFQQNMLKPTEDICSSMLADAFQSVNFPILPLVLANEKGYELIHRNPRLYTPSDFDYSPYFAVIKYPIFPLDKEVSYRNLPWIKDMISDDVQTRKINPEIEKEE